MTLNAREEFGQLLKQLRLSYVVGCSRGIYMGYRDIDVNNIEMGVRLPDNEYLRCLAMFIGKGSGMRRVFQVYDRLVSVRDRVLKTRNDIQIEPLDAISKFYNGLHRFGYTCCPAHEEYQTVRYQKPSLRCFTDPKTGDRRIVAQLDSGYFIVVKILPEDKVRLANCEVCRGNLEVNLRYWNTFVPTKVLKSDSEVFYRTVEECLEALIDRMGSMSIFCKRR